MIPIPIHKQSVEETAAAIKRIVIGSIIVEYGVLELIDPAKQELKQRARTLLNACRSVQSYLLNHPQASPEHKELFRKEFLRDSYVLISELLASVWTLREEDLENLIESIRSNTEPETVAECTDDANVNVE